MASEQPPIEAEPGASEAEASDDPLYDELVRLRVLGLRPDISTELALPELTHIADTACPEASADAERLKCTMKKAAKRFGNSRYGLALEALWGVDETYGWSMDKRRVKGMTLLNVHSKNAYDRSHRKRTARDFAAQLRALYEEAPQEGLAVEQRRSGFWRKLLTRRPFMSLVAVLLLAAGGVYIVGLFGFSGHSSPKVVPPIGTVIDATTGQLVKHVSSHTTPQFVQVGGGNILQACDPTTHPGCGVTGEEGAPLRVHIGDIVEFSTSLFNPNDIPVPYLRMYASTYGSSAGPGDWLTMSIRWPTQAGRMRGPGRIDRVEVIYPHSVMFPSLTYIPGSTVLFKPHDQLLAHLPDGIMEGGIALTNVGPPTSCSYCEQEYQRHVNFEVRVTNHGQPSA